MTASNGSQRHGTRATIGNIQSLRFLAAAWVLVYHFQPSHVFGLLPQALTRLGFAGVDIFFVISGAIMAETTRGMARGSSSALHFLSTRFARVYAGWWPFFLLYWLAYTATGTLRGDKPLLASFFLWPQNLQHYLLPITWTLSFELMFYCVVALVVLWNRARGWMLLLAIGTCVVLATASFWAAGLYTPQRNHEVTVLHAFYASPLLLELIAGFLASEYLHRKTDARIAPWCVALILFGVAAFGYQTFAPLSGGGMAGHFHLPERAFLLGGFATALVGCAMLLERRQISPFAWMQRLGDASYSLYLCHPLIMATMFRIARKSGLTADHYRLTTLIVAVAAVVYAVLHYRWIERPMNLRFKRLVDRVFTQRREIPT